MARKGPKAKELAKAKGKTKTPNQKDAQTYEHSQERLLVRPDVGLQAHFRPKKPPKTYRYDPSLDPALSWDTNADRERAEALIAQIENARDLTEAKIAAAQLRRMSRPLLNWAGKAERHEFTVPTLPLFVHERLSTQAILQSVKSHKRDKQQSLRLFADEELDVTDRLLKAYQHETGWVNRLILGDSLVVMNSLLQYEGLGGKVQMIYMDPPYGVRFGSNFQPFIRKRDVKHGDDEDLTREPEMVQAYRDTWELGLHSYLTYLRDRLLLCRELLHHSGSIFVQISDENLHHVREILDEVFHSENLCSVISFAKSSPLGTEGLPSVCDFILWYAKDKERLKYRQVYTEKRPGELGATRYTGVELKDGTRIPVSEYEGDLNGVRLFSDSHMSAMFTTPHLALPFTFEGRDFRPSPGRQWQTTQEGLRRLAEANRLTIQGNRLRFVRYLDDFPVN